MKKKTEAKRQAILDVAAEAFRELGFAGTSMSEICTRVGGSKATLYNYFSSKEELFYEIVFLSTEAEIGAVFEAIDGSREDIADALRHFGEKLLAFLYSPHVRAQRHLAVSESGRSNIGRLVYERGVLRSQTLMAAFLQQAMDQGKLRQADPMVAARHLCSLLESELLERYLFQVLGEVSAEEISAVTARAVAVFMAGYGANALASPLGDGVTAAK